MVVTRYIAGLLSSLLFLAFFRWTTIATLFHLVGDARVTNALFLSWVFCTMVATYYTFRAPPPWLKEWMSSRRWYDARIYIEDVVYLVIALPLAAWAAAPHQAEPRTFVGTLIGDTLAIFGFGLPLRFYIRLVSDLILRAWRWLQTLRTPVP